MPCLPDVSIQVLLPNRVVVTHECCPYGNPRVLTAIGSLLESQIRRHADTNEGIEHGRTLSLPAIGEEVCSHRFKER